MERMDELEYYRRDDAPCVQGFRRIQVGESVHPYMENWWLTGHIIGYGDKAYDLITTIKEGKNPSPDFKDGLVCQLVLDAAERSANTRRWEKVEV